MALAPSDPVLRLVIARAQEGRGIGVRADGARLALAVEGGGMAAAVSAGMCMALEALGLIDSFDAIYGSSAGAINASYTAASQARDRAELYALAARRRVVDPRRAILGRPPFRLQVLSSLLSEYPHHPRVLSGPLALRVTACRVESKTLDVLGDFRSLDELREAVWASSAVPVLAGDVVEFRGQRYVDGGLIESIPYAAALRDGATHVLVLRSRHAGYRKSEFTGIRRRMADRLLRGTPETVAEMVYERPGRYNAEAALLESPESARLEGCVTQLAPCEGDQVSQVEWRPRRLLDSVALGARTAQRAFTSALAGAGLATHPPSEVRVRA